MNTHLLVAPEPAIHPSPISMATIITSHFLVRPNKSYAHLCSFNNKTYSSSSTNGGVTDFPAQKRTGTCDCSPIIARRSGNYKPTIWDFTFIESLNSEYSGERYFKRASVLKARLMTMLEDAKEPIDQLELIDDLQRLGISYHFEEKIKQILTKIYEQKHLKNHHVPNRRNLYYEALEFRLMRQHGYKISQEVFDCYKNEKGDFETSLRNDTKGLLQLYEASHMLIEGESTLELAREFATNILKNINLDHEIDKSSGLLVSSALELPLQWRAERPYSRWFIYAYESRPDKNNIVLEFAKLDFNIIQATYQEELKHVSWWWKRTGLAEKLPFARDSIVESYIWTIGGFFEPQHGYARTICAKAIILLTLVDDIYDVYGTLEELRPLTDVIQRWDIEKIEQLPQYMQICVLALNEFINGMENDVLKTQGSLITPYLRKSWADLCTAYLQEAKWYFEEYTPRLEEYMDNAWISVGGPLVLCHAFFALENLIAKEDPQFLSQDIVRWTSIIIRLADDIGTSPEEMKRGDVSKTMQCYMNETGASGEEAEEYARFLTREAWRKINTEQVLKFPFSNGYIKSAIGLGRMAQYIYQHGDGYYTTQYPNVKDHTRSLLFENIA